MSPRKLSLSIALALAALGVSSAHAAGLGRLTVRSALGQPLSAEVEVTSLSRAEAASLTVKVASPEAFKQAGLEYSAALSGLRLTVEPRGEGRGVVKITSAQPLNEPFIDLLLELNWASGRFVREYTFLLDPPDLMQAQAAGKPADATAAGQAVAPTTESPAAATKAAPAPKAEPAPGARSAAAPAPAPKAETAASTAAGAAQTVTVNPGDTLGRVAARLKPAAVSLDQAVIAIYEANPDAFFGSVHQMLAGAVLNVPDEGKMAAVDPQTAAQRIRESMRDFEQYRARLAAGAREVPANKAGQSAAGSVSALADEKAAPAGGADQLKLSRSSPQSSGKGAAAGSAEEARVAAEAAAREAQARVKDLERNVADLQRLLEMKNRQLADMQKQAEAKGKPSAVAPSAAPAVVDSAQKEAAQKEAAQKEAAQKEAAQKEAAQKEAAPKEAVADQPKTEAAPATPAVPAAPKPVKPLVAEEPGFFEGLLDDPMMLAGLGGVVVLAGGYGLYTIRRRRKQETFEDSLMAGDGMAANSLFGATGGATVDTQHSMFTAGAEAGSEVHSTEVDPIAEAEVYIAYGREAQAEEILREALKKQPERQAIRMKLLEIFASRKDAQAFSAVAREMYEMTGGHNEEWPKVVTLGLSVDPDNPLYTGLGPDEPHPASAPEGTAGAAGHAQDVPELDFDLDLDSALGKAASTASRPADSFEGADTELARAVRGRFDLPDLSLNPSADTGATQDAGRGAAELPGLPSIDQPETQSAQMTAGGDTQAGGFAATTSGEGARWQEMATKLDLAAAYEEIGDKEGARELLQEVLQGGDAGQQEQARAMIAKLA